MASPKNMTTYTVAQLDAIKTKIIDKQEVVDKQYKDLEKRRKEKPDKYYGDEFLSLYQESEVIQILQLQYRTMIMTNQYLLIIRFAEAP